MAEIIVNITQLFKRARRGRRALARHANREAGFTLVEVMTVLVIIGLISSVVILNFPAQKTALYKRANALLGHVNFAAQNAVLSGRIAALGVSATGYSLYNFQDGDWVVTQRESWPESVQVNLSKNAQDVKLPDEEIPVVMFEPTGLSDIFSVTLTGQNSQHFELSSSGDGRVFLRPVL